MNSKSLLIDKSRLTFLIEGRQDSLGKNCYVVTSSLGKVRFRAFNSVMDFLEMNKDLGYIE